MLRAAIGLETAQLPSVAVDTHSDFVVGWEMEGLSLPRVAASLVDNQPDTAQLALHAAGHRLVNRQHREERVSLFDCGWPCIDGSLTSFWLPHHTTGVYRSIQRAVSTRSKTREKRDFTPLRVVAIRNPTGDGFVPFRPISSRFVPFRPHFGSLLAHPVRQRRFGLILSGVLTNEGSKNSVFYLALAIA
jgi:hypothetical protein